MIQSINTFDSCVKAVAWSNDRLRLLDQRELPGQVKYMEYDDVNQVTDAIRSMVVRGAPAIGITAAYAVVLAARAAWEKDPQQWREMIQPDLERLIKARPTAVNLAWAIAEMQKLFSRCEDDPVPTLLTRAKEIHEEDIRANRTLGDLGSAVIGKTQGVLTHCNAGALATGGYGTALGVIRSGWSKGNIQQVYVNETRPWLQGARLTTWELMQDKIPVTLITDNAASLLMKSGRVQWLVAGADRIAANGDVANKIGTYQLAIAAKHHGVRFMVAAPTSTIDLNIQSGDEIPIEERPETEVSGYLENKTAPENCVVWNPAFDVTPAALIDTIVTESGVINRPDKEKIRALFTS